MRDDCWIRGDAIGVQSPVPGAARMCSISESLLNVWGVRVNARV